MDPRKLFESEAAALIEDFKGRVGSLVKTVSEADRPLLERSLTRAAVLGGELLISPGNQAATAELASVVNTLKFMEAKYAISAAREVREFMDLAINRVASMVIGAAFGAI